MSQNLKTASLAPGRHHSVRVGGFIQEPLGGIIS